MERTELAVADMDATELAELIEKGTITSRKAVELYIEQLEKINPAVNCLVENRFEEALAEADEADRRIAANKAEGKLLGVPISMKEAFHVKGMQTTGGLLHRKGMVQSTDAEVVQRLKSEGAILLGKTNTPELCFCQETDNKLYGRTNNPWDLTRTAGGSSGGEAALIAAGGAAAGFGSDIGGSIRFPSHFNGVIGFKSGKGQVSSFGSYPKESHELQRRMLGIGPIVKSVRDARLIYNIAAKVPAEEKNLENFTINILPETGYPLSLETAHFLDSIYASSKELFKMKPEVPPYFRETSAIWQEIMSIDGANGAAKEAFGSRPVRPYRTYLKEKATGKADLHRYLSWALIGASLFKPSEKRLKEIENIIVSGDEELEVYLENQILVFPVYHRAAPKHGEVYKEIFSIKKTYLSYMPYIAYANVWGLPALTVPVGKDGDGMPIAVQIISKNGNEDALFAFGEWLETNFPAYERAEV